MRKPVNPPPPELRRRMAEGKVVPFIGAGLSMGARTFGAPRMPGYGKLLERVAQRIFGNGIDLIATALLKEQNYDGAAERIRKRGGELLFYKAIRDILLTSSVAATPSPAHEFLNLLNFKAIITTNYDRLLEGFLEPTPEVFTQLDGQSMSLFLAEEHPFIFKVHGDVTRPETIVSGTTALALTHHLTTDTGRKLRTFLQTIFLTRTVLFLGCSFRDREFTDLLELISRELGAAIGPHYALVEKGVISPDRQEDLLRRLGLRFIEYEPDEDHSQVWEFLALLKPFKERRFTTGSAWKQFYLLEERPRYLARQRAFEERARSIRFLTPSLTNAIATDAYLEGTCPESLRRFAGLLKDRYEKFEEDVIEEMKERRDNVIRRLREDNIEVRAIFLKSMLERELASPVEGVLERYRLLLELSRETDLEVRLFPESLEETSFRELTYALILGDTPRPEVDVAMAYASQATTNFFQCHIIQVNTRQVTKAIARFERFWASSMSEKDSLEYVQDLVQGQS